MLYARFVKRVGNMARTQAALTGKTGEIEPAGTGVPLDLFSLSAQIANELAAGLSDVASVKERYGISDAQWAALKVNKAFRQMLKEAIGTWTGDLNAGTRITKKSEIILEDSLQVLDSIAHNVEHPPLARIEAIKQMSSLAGRNVKDTPGVSGGGGFVLNINIDGKNAVTVEPQRPALEHDDSN